MSCSSTYNLDRLTSRGVSRPIDESGVSRPTDEPAAGGELVYKLHILSVAAAMHRNGVPRVCPSPSLRTVRDKEGKGIYQLGGIGCDRLRAFLGVRPALPLRNGQ